MTRWIIGTSIRLQYLVLILAVVLMFLGISQVQEMPVDIFPELDPPLVQVQTESLGLSAVEMESLITAPLEATMLNGVAWLDRIESETVTGLSSILLVFEAGTDPIRARQMVQERLVGSHALPNVASPPTMLNPLSSNSRVMIVSLSSADISLIDLSVLARWTIVPRLLGVEGVANVSTWGQRDWQLQVQVDPEELKDQDVTLLQVIETTGNSMWVSPLTFLRASSPGTSGWIDTPNQRLSLQHILSISSAAELAQIPVAGHSDLVLGDVAHIVEDHQELIGDALLADSDGLMLVIEKFPNVSTLEVTQGIEEAIDAMRPGLNGITIDTTVFRPANSIELATKNLSSLLLLAVALVVLVLFAFYFNWRSALVSLMAIALSLVTAIFVLYLRGTAFNVMALAGLAMALYIIIDDSIVDGENILRRLREAHDTNSGESTATIISEASLETRKPLWFAFLVSVLIGLPLLFIGGLRGTFFQPFVISYLIATAASLMVAVIATPALSAIVFANVGPNISEPGLMKGIRSTYRRMLTGVLNAPGIAIGVALVIIVLGIGLLLPIRTALMPDFKQTELQIQWVGAPSISRGEMLRVTSLVANELRGIEGVSNLGSHVGRAITGDRQVNVNHSEIWLSIDPLANYEETVAQVEEVINGYPGLFRTVDTYQPELLKDVFGQPEQDVTVRVYGDDFDTLTTTAYTVTQAISGIDGVVHAQPEYYVNEPQIEIQVDLNAANRYEISPGEVRRAVAVLLSGLTVGHLYEEQRVFEVIVWGTPELRDSVADVENLMIETPTGLVPLHNLADVHFAPSPSVIRRDAVKRYIDVHVATNGRDFAALSADINAALAAVEFPLEYYAAIRGTSNQAQTINQVMLVVTVIIGVFLLLQASFQSWRLAAITILGVPLALSGAVFAMFLLGGGVISLGSVFGLLAVLVVAIRHILVTTNHLEALRQRQGASLGMELVLQSAQDRVVPLLMTFLSLLLVTLPFIFAGIIAGTEILYPMAIAMLGGLVTTGLLSLFILPALYLRFGPVSQPAPQTNLGDIQAAHA